MSNGWIKVHRALLYNSIFSGIKLLKVFLWCLLKATHTQHDQLVGKQFVKLNPGQFVTGRIKAGAELSLAPSTAWEYLKVLENNNTIRIESNNKFSIVTVINWEFYQGTNEKSDNRDNNKKAANSQQNNTNKKGNNDNNDKYKYVVDHLNNKTGSKYKDTTIVTRSLIDKRLSEGFTMEDLLRVIDNKVVDWEGTEREIYLRPVTLFGEKFESYLNQTSRKLDTIDTERDLLTKIKNKRSDY